MKAKRKRILNELSGLSGWVTGSLGAEGRGAEGRTCAIDFFIHNIII